MRWYIQERQKFAIFYRTQFYKVEYSRCKDFREPRLPLLLLSLCRSEEWADIDIKF